MLPQPLVFTVAEAVVRDRQLEIERAVAARMYGQEARRPVRAALAQLVAAVTRLTSRRPAAGEASGAAACCPASAAG